MVCASPVWPDVPRSYVLSYRFRLLATFTMSQAAKFGAQHITRGIGRMSQHVFTEARGTHLFTDQGKRLLDMTSYVFDFSSPH